MNRLLTTVLFLLIVDGGLAQRLTVTEFYQDPLDNAAIKFEKKDLNKDPCALIIAQIPLVGVTFEGDIIETVEKGGEYWIYMGNGATWLEIKASGYLSPQFDITEKYPQGLVGKMTYRLFVEKPQTGDMPKGTIVINSNVEEADFFVDGIKQQTGHPPFTYHGGEGAHKVLLKSPGYNDESMEVDILLGQTKNYVIKMKAEGSFSVDGISYEMVNIPQGTFMMGSRLENNSYSTFSMDKPAHRVTLRAFSIGKTEVSQSLWQTIMGSNPSINQGPDLPVENVSWDDCQLFIQRLNQRCGTNFRFPTEAEWEYAADCCNGELADTYSGTRQLMEVANIGTCTIACGSKLPSSIGLYDMTGNVAEWCQDYIKRYTYAEEVNPTGPTRGFLRVIRGGAFSDEPTLLRNSHRNYMKQEESSPKVGLRLAHDL